MLLWMRAFRRRRIDARSRNGPAPFPRPSPAAVPASSSSPGGKRLKRGGPSRVRVRRNSLMPGGALRAAALLIAKRNSPLHIVRIPAFNSADFAHWSSAVRRLFTGNVCLSLRPSISVDCVPSGTCTELASYHRTQRGEETCRFAPTESVQATATQALDTPPLQLARQLERLAVVAGAVDVHQVLASTSEYASRSGRAPCPRAAESGESLLYPSFQDAT